MSRAPRSTPCLCLGLVCLLLAAGCGGEPPESGGTAPAGGVPAAGSTGAPSASSAAAQKPATASFDARWAPYFPAGTLVYGAVRTLDFYNPTLGKPENASQLKEARAKFAAAGAPGGSFADWLQEVNDFLLERKLVQVSFIELFERGFAFGLEYHANDSEPELTLLAPRGPKVAAFLAAWEKEGGKGVETVRKKAGDGELVVQKRRERRAPFCWLTTGELILAGSNPALLEAAVQRAARGDGGIATTASHRDAVAKLSADSVVFLAFDTARLAENLRAQTAASTAAAEPAVPTTPAPGFPAAAGIAQAMLGRVDPKARTLETVEALRSFWVQFVYQENLSHLDLHFGLAAGAAATSSSPLAMLAAAAPGSPLRSPSLASVNNPIYVAFALPKDQPASGASAAGPGPQLGEQLAMTAAMTAGLDYAKDVQPWLGRELALSVLWDAKLPQVALMLAAEDAEACRKAAHRAALNFKGKLKFEEKTVGAEKLWAAPLPDRPQVSVCYAVSGGFLILASGQQVAESLLDAPQKLRDHPGFASLFSVLGGDRVQMAGFLSVDMLERLAEMTGGDSAALEIQVRAACLDNLGKLAAGKLAPDQAFCPGGGKYKGTPFECSVHGEAGKPKPAPPAAPDPQVAAARQLSALISSVSVGAGPSDADGYRVSFVLRRR